MQARPFAEFITDSSKPFGDKLSVAHNGEQGHHFVGDVHSSARSRLRSA